ncbi:DUF4198 domain-containing protein [Aquisphaera insulae]|uniref:DUF4198 domain-containing protein n=1 Tax=Aquisphaera insulae TaxID=2712864 RepID=UPI0013ED053B|nr:DUF4198 domain-containing protein [Aquisphaera insulae]
MLESTHRSRHDPAWLVLGLFLVVGCRGEDTGPRVYPVSGRILVDGKPAAKAEISFHPLDPRSRQAPQPIAIAEEDGSFRPSTRLSQDGAPAGEYTLTVVWRKIRVDHGEEVAGADQLNGRYNDPHRSGLRVTIKEDENTLDPIHLSLKAKTGR